MAKRHHAFLGPALVLVFCVSQAFRDVYFGHVFQGVDFFAVILLAFLASTILFTRHSARARPERVRQSCAATAAPC